MVKGVNNGSYDIDRREKPGKKHKSLLAYDFGSDPEDDDFPEYGKNAEYENGDRRSESVHGYYENAVKEKQSDIPVQSDPAAPDNADREENVRKPKTDPGSVIQKLNLEEIGKFERYIRKTYPELEIDKHFSGQDGVPGLLGSGGFGKVFRCYERENPKLTSAVKILIGTDKDKARREYDIQSELNAQAVVKLDGFKTLSKEDGEADNVIAIKMELMEGTLKDLMKKSGGVMSVPDVVDYMIEICEMIGYIHKRGITHGDIKPANILYKIDDYGDKPRITFRIGDFGLAKELDGTVSSFAGTPEYYFNVLETGPERDVYALGITMLELFGANPRSEEFMYRRAYVDPKYNTSWELVKGLNVDRDILQVCLTACYAKKSDRCTCDEFRQSLVNWKQTHAVEFELRDDDASALYRKATEMLNSSGEDEEQKNLALRYLAAAGHKGSDKAYFTLFRLFKNGSAADKAKAEEYLGQAASLGNADAKNTFAVRQLRILGPNGNPEKISKMADLLREAMPASNAAKYNLALLLKTHMAEGREDPDKLIAKAASAGYGPAKAYLEKKNSYETD